jgi:diguanylate cyclase (GGDEF)-like protein
VCWLEYIWKILKPKNINLFIINMQNLHTILLVTNNEKQKVIFDNFAKHISRPNLKIISHDNQDELSAELLHEINPDIMFFDVNNCDNLDEAYNFVELIREWQKTLPIIFIMPDEDENEINRLLERGVQDYLVAGQDNFNLIRRIIRHAMQRKRYEDKLSYLTMQDHLTGLMSGDLIPSALRQAINSAKREKSIVAVYFIDIDHFKIINDAHSHAVGNALLIEIAARLQKIVRDDCILARFSGDLFVLIDVADDLDACSVMAEEIITGLKDNIKIGEIEVSVSSSIGVATFPECGSNESELLQHAEISLNDAKQAGRGGYRFFSHELNKQATWRIHITTALKEMISLNDDSFSLHYQPKINLNDGSITGVEALIRWNHPIYGMVRPDQFIPLAEEAGLINNVTAWVAETAARQHKEAGFNDITMAINISARELSSNNFVSLIDYVLHKYNMPPEMLVLEITETAMMSDSKKAMGNMQQIKDLGVKLNIDDFGTGYSSIDYLRRYPVDALKIDRSFIMHMHEQRDDARVVKLMVDIAGELGLKVVAEGVEIAQQSIMLKEMQCTEAQGYYYSRPIPAEAFIQWRNNYKINNKK